MTDTRYDALREAVARAIADKAGLDWDHRDQSHSPDGTEYANHAYWLPLATAALSTIPDQSATIAAQAERIARLEAAMKPFADCCDQIAEDEPDEEWAKFRLIVRNYRDARQALSTYATKEEI